MNDISMVCKKHGLISKINIYVNPKNQKVCRLCKNESCRRLRYIDYPDSFKERKCSRCKKIKKKDEFGLSDWKLRHLYCSTCRSDASFIHYHKRKNHLKNYGITPDLYNKMFLEQKGLCAICNQKEKRKSKWKGEIFLLSVDHDHKTGKVRELLCASCNLIIGNINESIETCQGMIRYFKKHNK